jgi:type III restriction enzyme
MEIKEYQQKTLNILRQYLTALDEAQEKKATILKLGLDVPFSASDDAWNKALPGTLDEYKKRYNGLGEDLPSICFKVPTGGGKTFLAVLSIDLINTLYRKQRTGMVLWIVPTTQIYRQTLNALRNREHYYRQTLDRASAGRTLILEKTDRFTPQQLESNLIVMMLMLPSANRLNKETLKVFQDSGGFEDFFPDEGNGPAQERLLQKYPNLDYFGDRKRWSGATVKTSLGTTLRVIKPVIIIDEGHKTYSAGAQDTIRSFNPSFVLELSATPTRASNVLVTIHGAELDREEMIKLDLNVYNNSNEDWKVTMLDALKRRELLEESAIEYESQTGVNIRPICLIQVERTGRDQESGHWIHANHVRRFLIEQCSVPPEQIAIKSSETDGLEDIDLLDRDCPIRFIITKQALQEGWDCAFAYVLTILANPSSESGLTQLVGRVLRQPFARKTRIKELDESYVYCFRRNARNLLASIRKGFSDEGLDGLENRAREVKVLERVTEENKEVGYRPQFKKFEGKIYLPRFVIQEERQYRDLDYETDIASRIDWDEADLTPLESVQLSTFEEIWDNQMRVGYREGSPIVVDEVGVSWSEVALGIDRVFMTLQIVDIVPNPWMAFKIVSRTLDMFSGRHDYDEEQIAANLVLIVDELKKRLAEEKDRLAALVFHDLIESKTLCFFLQAVRDYEVPRTIKIRSGEKVLVRDDNTAIQQSLFEYQPEEDYNNLERSVAVYLDEQGKLLFWYRNLTGKDYFYVQGWKKPRIWADFITTHRATDDPTDYSQIIVLETKGLHLKGNADTTYKENIFALCNELGHRTNWEELGHEFRQDKITFQVIYEDEWKTRINDLFS